MGVEGVASARTPSCAAATARAPEQRRALLVSVGRIDAVGAAAGVHSPRCVLRAGGVVQRCHCCARLWRGASTSVVALLLVWASRYEQSLQATHARRRAFWGRLWAEQKLWLKCSAVSKQLLSGASAAQNDDRRPKVWISHTYGGVTGQISCAKSAVRGPAAPSMAALAAATNINGVTCVVPAYNASRTIDACLASLLAQRTDLPIEVIVVDDGSEDDTAVIVERWQARFARLHMSLRVIRQANGRRGAREMLA